jgi:hypothetical protein
MDKTDCGRLGGLQTSLTHTHEHYQSIGHKGGLLGGRPRRRTLAELRSAPEAKIYNFEEENLVSAKRPTNPVFMGPISVYSPRRD